MRRGANRSSSDTDRRSARGARVFRDSRPMEGGRMALWFFQRTAPGSIRRIPLPAMQRFLSGERALPHDGDGYVRCIGMALELRNRKPSAVRRVWFSKMRVEGNGGGEPELGPSVLHRAASA